MGASYFCVRSKGRTAQEAFDAAVEEARYDYGHAGYTGTLAEKTSFVMIEPPTGDRVAFAASLEDAEEIDPRVEDKWGPAGCVEVGPDGDETMFVFFGWASS